MYAGPDGVEDVSAIELAGGQQIERGNEETHPAGDEHGVADHESEGGYAGMHPREQGMNEADGPGIPEANQGGGWVLRQRLGERESDDDCDQRRDISTDGAVDTDVEERVAVGDPASNENDGAGRAAESGRREQEGQRGIDAVSAASEVVAEFVGQQDGKQCGGEWPAEKDVGRMLHEPGPWPQITVRGDGGQSEKKVLHETRADGHRCEDADGEQDEGKRIPLLGGARGSCGIERSSGCLEIVRRDWDSRRFIGQVPVPGSGKDDKFKTKTDDAGRVVC